MLKPRDCVLVLRLPASFPQLPKAEQRVYQACVGLKLQVLRVTSDGDCTFDLGQMWHHFPSVTPFEPTFEASCLRKVVPFSASEWETILGWTESDAPLHGIVVQTEFGGFAVRLPGDLEAELASDLLPGDPVGFVGRPLAVRLVRLNQTRRDLLAHPQNAGIPS